MNGGSSESGITIHRVTDPASDDLQEALNLYTQRIPEPEQCPVPDIIRWLRLDLEQRQTRPAGSRDYFLVAKVKNRLCGLILIHYYPSVQLAFIAYLVTAKKVRSLDRPAELVSKRLLSEVRRVLNDKGHLSQCRGVLMEVHRPDPGSSETEWTEHVARIRLFCTLAETQGMSLRAFDIEYVQPPLSVAEPNSTVPMLLMYVDMKTGNRRSQMSRNEVRRILKFIYTKLYPEGYSDSDDENRDYRACLQKFWAK